MIECMKMKYTIARHVPGSGVYSAGPLEPGGAWVKYLAFLDIFLVTITYLFFPRALHSISFIPNHHAQRL
jgi:hypothetical protein